MAKKYSLYLMLIVLSGCVTPRVTLKTFVDPSLQSSSINSIAVFSLRNTALSPGEALEIDRAITQGFIKKNGNVNVMGASEATAKLNDANLVTDYSKFLMDFESSGIANTTTLQKVGDALSVNAILQGRLSDVVQKTGSYPGVAPVTSLTLRYTLLSCKTGNTLWEGTSNSAKYGATVFSQPPPLYEVIFLAQEKIFTGLPALGH